jgi:TldD protein
MRKTAQTVAIRQPEEPPMPSSEIHAFTAETLFFAPAGIESCRAADIVGAALAGCDDGELFLEARRDEAIALDDGVVKTATYGSGYGFGLRACAGEATAYAHAEGFDEASLKRAAAAVAAVRRGGKGSTVPVPAPSPSPTNRRVTDDLDPLAEHPFADKVELLRSIDTYARGRDAAVRQVMASLAASWQAVAVLRADGSLAFDVRPLVRLNVSVMMERNGRRETGSFGCGGRESYGRFIAPASWRAAADEAIRQAGVALESVEAPAGEMTVVLGPGWPGILLHEAIGHGLEGDFNRKGTSAFAGRIGERVAARGVTVVDDGTLPNRRGSLSIDDEGTPSSRTVLIEDGILTGYMQDRLNARLMGAAPTGNGRRESRAHCPLPRMTNTIMLAGTADPGEILAGVKKGLYAVNFGGGQVDITSGKFVFSASEAYLIENGRVGAPVKGATLIGNGPDVLTRVVAVGNDLQLDRGVGTCGKDGQGVPVGVGQPTLRLDGLTVGGTRV